MWLICVLAWAAPEEGVFGQEPRADVQQVAISELKNDPENYLDQVVQVVGEVTEVCPMKGCWMDLSGDGQTVRVKVKDGEIVFTQDLVGKRVIAEGTVYKFELTREQAVTYFAHLAEEKGEEFDPESITSGTTIYQIGGIGAKVQP